MVKELTAPNLQQVVEVTKGRWLNGEKRGKHARILNVIIGAMTAKVITDYFKPGVLVIVPGDREDVLFAAMSSKRFSSEQGGVSGLILTRNVLPTPKMMEYLRQTDLPVIICEEESYSIASKINSMTVKTQPEDSDKIPLIQQTIMDSIEVEKIFSAFE